MSTIFLSYSRQDTATAQHLTRDLTAHGKTIWRDVESLRGGQRWPKAIGEAIAQHDVLLLLWSQQAAQSHFVEFEWSTAIALQKTVLPYCLDETPLPAALSATHSIAGTDNAEVLRALLQALPSTPPPANPARQAEVLTTLAALPAQDPAHVVGAAHTLFAQQGWQAQTVYQAAGDIHVTMAPPVAPPPPSAAPSRRGVLERGYAWLVACMVLLTVMGLAVDLPGKFMALWSGEADETPVVYPLGGVIWDDRGQPLAAVEVFLPEFGLTTHTDGQGRYTFAVRTPSQRQVNLIARKPGYTTYDGDPTLGNTTANFTLRRSQ